MINIRRLVSLDCEASGLGPRTYPISIGISYADGTTRLWYVRPTHAWIHAGDWQIESEEVHGLDRDWLVEHGRPVETVAAELAEAVEGMTVFSDSGVDLGWIRTLYLAAGRARTPFAHIVWQEILEALAGGGGPEAAARIDAAWNAARRRFPATHKADEDARSNMEAVRILGGLA